MTKMIGFLWFMLSTILVSSAFAGNLSAADENRIKELAIEAILEQPEVIEEAITRLRQIQEQRQQEAVVKTLINRRKEFERDPNAPVLGNVDGDVTIVEFFDYNCPYCKRAAEPVQILLEADAKIRLVYREWPILSEGSVFAARAALASRKLGKYEEMHVALMSARRADENSTIKIAEGLGLDIAQLRRDMQSPEVEQHISLSVDLASNIGINGTPAFVIGNQLAPGLIPYEGLKAMVAKARGVKSR
jgi:protein-disulfide isomerase